MKNNLLSEKLIYTGESLTPTHLHLCTYNATEMQESSSDTFQAIKGTLNNDQINWLQIHGMKNTETIREICSHFEIDFLVLQDILNADHPTKIEEHDKYIVLILKIFYPNEHKEENELDELLQQQVCLIIGNNYVLTFLEKETDFFDDVSSALRNDVLKIRSRQTDYLLSVLLNSVMGNYISTISSIDDALEDLEEELLTITSGDDIGIQIQALRRQYMLMKKAILPLKEQYIKLLRAENLLIHKVNRAFFNDVNDHLQFVLQTIEICRETGCDIKTLPGIYQLLNGEVSVGKLRRVEIEDLLGRDPIRVNLDEIMDYVSGKVVMVTGGGGSIGSELCRQIAAHAPKRLVIFDVYENNAYDIEQELRSKYPHLDLVVLIGSVRDTRKINNVFETYKPDIVYHAAAHKHVPLMETSPCEAIKNNVMGTYKTAHAALKNGCQRFVLISTDKAVNPTNIMGASKRLCEMVIQTMDKISRTGREDLLPLLGSHYEDSEEALAEVAATCENPEANGERKYRTEFVAVRFGNVLGSNGSVIPLFKKQIAKGGPVTVMTIPEAVSLVLQAGTYAKGGEIFVLDMGAPVKIDTLARNLIKMSGLTPDVDIKVEYTGLRPGEKLYEEKLMAEEGLTKTDNDLIHIGKPIPFDTDEFLRQMEKLAVVAYGNDPDIRSYVEEIVPTYHAAKDDLKLHGDTYKKLFEKAAGNK